MNLEPVSERTVMSETVANRGAMQIAIVDYGSGNFGSIKNMVKKTGFSAHITSDAGSILKADKIILPGVGSFNQAMMNIEKLCLREVLEEKVIRGRTPLLGICLGMQILAERSEEGDKSGLGWIDADVVKFIPSESASIRVPHMGWNVVTERAPNLLFSGLAEEKRFYFVHSYYMVCRNDKDVVATTNHGTTFTCAIQRGNIYAVQFHPEKSHKFGMTLLKNFIEHT
jgi:glutamine amidotransferase